MRAVMPPAKGATLEQARAAKEEALKVFRKLGPVMGVGITRVGDGYGVKINVREPLAANAGVPDSVDGVPVRVEVVGVIQKS
jgi:hypothetical protein